MLLALDGNNNYHVQVFKHKSSAVLSSIHGKRVFSDNHPAISANILRKIISTQCLYLILVITITLIAIITLCINWNWVTIRHSHVNNDFDNSRVFHWISMEFSCWNVEARDEKKKLADKKQLRVLIIKKRLHKKLNEFSTLFFC